MKLPDGVTSAASIVTLLGLPVTLASLSNAFDVTEFPIQLPNLPGTIAFQFLIFFLFSIAFAKAFTGWFAYIDQKIQWRRMITIPILVLLSVAQSFVAIEVMFGPFGKGMTQEWFAFLMVLALGIELLFLRERIMLMGCELVHGGSAYFLHVLWFTLFFSLLGIEARNRLPVDDAGSGMFLVIFYIGIALISIVVWNKDELFD